MIEIQERYATPTPEYPMGSYLRTVAGEVEVATGYFAIEHPDKPSHYWHGGPPFVVYDAMPWPWEEHL